ncbi:MAG TPA: tRNA (N6-isopentenyl adenosine(37)-C2)-methylthiotransferase MiaB [Alphaproteobacteria bacterium]|nr:tRNA (N6-isopentenyl adenosine(37)-C2)-methylthiotransferase MiaB [Alphaproteobacteria bacterium]
MPSKKLYIKTYGCQMNVYDSTRMTDVLAPLGYETTEQADEADMVILNTCHIREKAAEKVYSDLGRLRALKAEKGKAGSELILGVAGCVAQAEGEEISKRAPFVDMVFGPQTYHRLPEMVAKATGRQRVLDTEFPAEDKFDQLPAPTAQGVTAFLSIQEGCDKFCTFCVVPYTRGAEYSRPAASIIAEAKALVAQGVRELTLLGQNVNAYHGDGLDGGSWTFSRLVRALAEIDGLARIRYTTSHPNDMDDDLIAAHGDLPQLMPFLHLPVQSGSDEVLKAMNRKYKADDFRRIVERLRKNRPDLALSSDFIVGFPGESDADFEATMQLVRETTFALAYSFKYSRRPGTPASVIPKQLNEEVKSARLEALQGLLLQQQKDFNASLVGREIDVLFAEAGRHAGQAMGRSPYLQSVHVQVGDDARIRAMIGQIHKVRVIGASANSLTGELLNPQREKAA